MADFILKLRMLRLCWPDVRYWLREVWRRDAGERICCNGYMCGCYGADYASMWEALLRSNQDTDNA